MFKYLKDKWLKITFGRDHIEYMGHGNFEFPDRIKFGKYIYIGPNAFWSAKGVIKIGNNVIFGPNTCLWSYSHNYNSSISLPYDKNDILKPIVIGDNVWVGMGAVILPGVFVGDGAVVAAHAVVTKNVDSCCVVAGNPAVVVKKRDVETYKRLVEAGQLYQKLKMEASGA